MFPSTPGFAAMLAMVAALLGCAADPPATPTLQGAASGYNVVLISVDTLRGDRLGAYGYAARPNSPRIDALLASGVVFDRAHATRASTWPALASVLTGLMPSGHGVTSNGFELAEGQPTLPLLLQQEGYQTAAFLSNMCRANHLGWDELFCAGGVDRRLNRLATAWLEEVDPTRPFLLWAHYFGPHPPYYNGGGTAREVLDPSYSGELEPRAAVLDRIMIEGIELDAADRQHLDAIYDAAVMGTDRLVGELLDALAVHTDLSRTLMVFVSDHGEDLYQHHGYLYHACSVYQSSLHVPLAFVAPGLLPAGARVPGNVSQVDVLPTLLELLDLDRPACQHGAELTRWLADPSSPQSERAVLTEYGDSRIQTLTKANWKLVINPEHEQPYCFEGAPVDLYPIAATELYDLARDPGEASDLAAAEPERVSNLSTELARGQAALCRGTRRDEQSLDEDLKRELEALGYVVGER